MVSNLFHQFALFAKFLDDTGNDTVDKLAALGGGVAVGNVKIFVESHGDRYLREGQQFGDDGAHKHYIHECQSVRIPLGGVDIFVKI